MKSTLERVSRLAGGAAGTVNIALARGRARGSALARAADDLAEAAAVLKESLKS